MLPKPHICFYPEIEFELRMLGLAKTGDSIVLLFPISLVLWRRNVPDNIVTKPHNSVAICDAFCESQSCKLQGKQRRDQIMMQ